jgi:hypothetical protein
MKLPSWKDITVEKYQFVNEIYKQEGEDIDKVINVLAVLLDSTPKEIGNLSIPNFHRLSSYVNALCQNIPQSEPKKWIKANGKRYYVNYNVESHRLAQYIEVQHFLKGGLIDNLHLIMASVVQPSRFFIKQKNDSNKHQEIAQDLLKANFIDLYNSGVFFCQVFTEFNKGYSGLLELNNEPIESEEVVPDFEESDEFQQRYGWIFSATQVAQHERITLDQAYDLNIVQAFNDLSYLKALKKHEEKLNKQYAKVGNLAS